MGVGVGEDEREGEGGGEGKLKEPRLAPRIGEEEVEIVEGVEREGGGREGDWVSGKGEGGVLTKVLGEMGGGVERGRGGGEEGKGGRTGRRRGGGVEGKGKGLEGVAIL